MRFGYCGVTSGIGCHLRSTQSAPQGTLRLGQTEMGAACRAWAMQACIQRPRFLVAEAECHCCCHLPAASQQALTRG